MPRPKILRLFRIAVSVVCGILCLLLMLSWARSTVLWENFHGSLPGGQHFVANSLAGVLSAGVGGFSGADKWEWINIPVSEPARRRGMLDVLEHEPLFGFGFSSGLGRIIVAVPHWILIALASSIAALPGLRRRFSLRTLLIATTLVAVALGLVVWAI